MNFIKFHKNLKSLTNFKIVNSEFWSFAFLTLSQIFWPWEKIYKQKILKLNWNLFTVFNLPDIKYPFFILLFLLFRLLSVSFHFYTHFHQLNVHRLYCVFFLMVIRFDYQSRYLRSISYSLMVLIKKNILKNLDFI